MSKSEQAIQYFRDNQKLMTGSYLDLVRIPSISTDPDHKADMVKAAQFLASTLADLGFDRVEIFETKMHPIMFAEKKSGNPNAKTLLIYGHYDVQPVDPLDEWKSDPFEPEFRGEYLYARGASDMKGQVMASIIALDSVLKTTNLPINIKYLLEGEEEIGSPSLEGFIADHTDLLSCDMILNPDAGMVGKDQPTLVYGLRGMTYFEVRVDGPKADLHSGLWGGNVANPAIVLSEIIAKLHNPDGSVAIHGFYDRVAPLNDEEREQIAANQTNEQVFLEVTGSPALYGEAGYTPLERQGARPTLDVNGFYSGFIGEGAKTIIPAYAKAKISCRLVPNQDPVEIFELAKKYILSIAPDTVRIKVFLHSAGPAYLANDAPGAQNLVDALSEVWQTPVTFKREGGSIPVATVMQRELGVKSLLTGFGLPDDAIHSPNERMHFPSWLKGIEALIRFYLSFGED
ncbi:MAG: dipeptidase [Anaerolineaceae bacterium]|nr:dipeptidase [Anaerolineaceae bacterium]MDD4043372.1 dipeptidase [Anaerolineaceae bacterium]MDD4578295.1 dipeptidase [Anaerolineaceae bacterium]